MATFTAIKNKTQSGGAMRGVLDYISQKEKTMRGDRQLVTGWNCVAQSAYDEMMATKRQYGKTDGRMFYQFVQSFSPEEQVTPEEVHAIGIELAEKLFPDYEVVVATHVDTDHLHSHIFVNSVSCADGGKLHQNAADLQRQRQISDEICAAHGLTVLKPPRKYAQEKKMRPGEYRSAVRGESWKLLLMNTIDLCMRKARTKAGFLREMENRGYHVRWEPARKSITYTTPTGMKCRDNKLHDEKYLKEVMEREFQIRAEILVGRIEAEEFADGDGSTSRDRLSYSGAVGADDAISGRAVPSGRGPAATDGSSERNYESDALRAENTGSTDGTADDINSGVDLSAPTGWEKEREAAFAYAQAQSPGTAHAVSGMALGGTDPGGVVHSLLQLGHRLELLDRAAPVPAPVMGRGDRKALAREREKKIAQGHKADDHEDHPTWQQTMY